MRFAPTADQQLFTEAIGDLLADACPPDRVRAAWDQPADRELWNQLAAMGVLGLLAPESAGGMGLEALDLHPLLVETGKVAMTEPIVDTAAIVVPVLAASEHPLLAQVVDGTVSVAVGFARDHVVRVDADQLLLQWGGTWHLVPTAEVEQTAERSVDGSRRLASITWSGSDEHRIAHDRGAIVAAADRGVVGISAQLLGLASHLLEETVAYVQVREQFGKPVGAQQAIKHKLTDVLLALDFARPVVARAAYSLSVGDPDASMHASMAKCYAAEAAHLATRHALQCHGAIAYTVEHDLHMWIKRVWALCGQWGDANFHRRRVGELLAARDS